MHGTEWRRKGQILWLSVLFAAISVLLTGCMAGQQLKKVEDLEFDVAAQGDIPEALLRIIEEKKTAPFKLTYSNNGLLYIVVGYGTQETGGYSIQVPELYRTEDSIVIKTELVGPTAEEAARESYPYVVVTLTDISLPVLFE